jgi:phosphoribosylformimino-5-aminoimidazole carboxamide ribotide isomerase
MGIKAAGKFLEYSDRRKNMIIIPAIDLISGHCVRLTRGKFNTEKRYFDDPVEVAARWQEAGAEWLHIIDLEGARTGRVKNLAAAEKIREKVDIKMQYGGGIRNFRTVVKILNTGIEKIILGTRAIDDIEFLKNSISNYKGRIILSLDYTADGTINKNGWQMKSRFNVFEFINMVEESGLEEIIITDISRDGTLKGINLGFLKRVLISSNMSFIIAGGISSLNDIKRLKGMEYMGIRGVIIGKALYDEKVKIDLKKAIEIGLG